MISLKHIRLACLLVALMACLRSTPVGATSAHTFRCSPGSWNRAPSPNPFQLGDNLLAVAAVSVTDVWAAGYGIANNKSKQALIEQWNGSLWQAIPSPRVAGSQLDGIVALSANNVWAVGFAQAGTLIEQWNGSQWQVIASPNTGTQDMLNSVAALSATDIWAVGAFSSGNVSQTLTEHWDGTHWSIISSPNVPSYANTLSSVTAISSSNVWAVGSDQQQQNGLYFGLTEHWNGHAWRIVSIHTPNGSLLQGAAAIDASHIWAVGDAGSQTLTYRWNGRQWRHVPSPSPSPYTSSLYGVAARNANDAWAVGWEDAGSNGLLSYSLHWNGKMWQLVETQHEGDDDYLSAVAMTASQGVWAVGSYDIVGPPDYTYTLIEYYC